MRNRFSIAVSMLLAACSIVSGVYAEDIQDTFAEQVKAAYAEPEMQYRPYARWWLAEGSHTDETLIESIHELYDGTMIIITPEKKQEIKKRT